MIEWFPEIDSKAYHLLVFNTIVRSRKKSPTGRLLLCSFTKEESDATPLVLKTTIHSNTPVHSVAPYNEQSSLIYSSGTELVMVGLDTSPNGIRFIQRSRTLLRSPGRYITVKEPFIYMSTAEDSLQIYKHQEGQLSHWQGDTIARPGAHHANIPEKELIIASDRVGNVFGLWQPSVHSANNALITVFEATFPRAITRLVRIQRPAWTRDRLLASGSIVLESQGDENETHCSTSSMMPTPYADAGIEVLVGTSTDGTLTQFSVVPTGWRLLKFVQNMSEQNPDICPFRVSRRKHIEPIARNSRLMHINGDILQSALLGNADQKLKAMLDKPVMHN